MKTRLVIISKIPAFVIFFLLDIFLIPFPTVFGNNIITNPSINAKNPRVKIIVFNIYNKTNICF